MSTAHKPPVNTVKLGDRPKAFAPVTVEAPMPDGSTGRVQVTYTYRTRAEFGAFVDAFFAAPDAAKAAATGPADEAPAADEAEAPAALFRAGDHMDEGTRRQAEYLAQVVDAWDLDTPLSPQALLQLCNQFPAVAGAVRDRYRELVTEGRLGN